MSYIEQTCNQTNHVNPKEKNELDTEVQLKHKQQQSHSVVTEMFLFFLQMFMFTVIWIARKLPNSLAKASQFCASQ